MEYKITYTSLSAQAYYFHRLPRHLMQRMYSCQLDESVRSVMPNHCCSQSHQSSDCAEQFDSVDEKSQKQKCNNNNEKKKSILLCDSKNMRTYKKKVAIINWKSKLWFVGKKVENKWINVRKRTYQIDATYQILCSIQRHST